MNISRQLDALSPEQTERLSNFGAGLCEWADEENRATHTRFGYNHGCNAGMCTWMFGPLVAVGFAWVIAAMIWLPHHPLSSGLVTSLFFGSIVLAFAPLPIVPFIFLKPKHALVRIAVLAAFLFAGVLCTGAVAKIFG